jgi:hypothetical protein
MTKDLITEMQQEVNEVRKLRSLLRFEADPQLFMKGRRRTQPVLVVAGAQAPRWVGTDWRSVNGYRMPTRYHVEVGAEYVRDAIDRILLEEAAEAGLL